MMYDELITYDEVESCLPNCSRKLVLYALAANMHNMLSNGSSVPLYSH